MKLAVSAYPVKTYLVKPHFDLATMPLDEGKIITCLYFSKLLLHVNFAKKLTE